MSFYDDASLVLLAGGAAGKDGKVYNIKPISPAKDFTFARGNDLTATRVGKDGYIEKGRTIYTLNTVWAGAGTLVKPTGWSDTKSTDGDGSYAPVAGSNGQIKFEVTDATDSSNDERFFLQSAGSGVTPAGIYATSVYVDEVTGTAPAVRDVVLSVVGGSDTKTNIGFFKNDTESIDATTAVEAGNRYTVVAYMSGSGYHRFGLGTNADINSNCSVTLSRPQIETGLVSTTYRENTSTTDVVKIGLLEDEPRFDYTGGGCPALLIESTKVNYINHSEYGGGYEIVDSNVTVTDNAEVSPEGLKNAVKIEDISTSSATQAVKFGALESGSVVGRTFTASLYIKPVNSGDVGGNVYLSIQRRGGDFEGSTETIQIDSADWKRYEMTYTFTGAGTGNQTGCDFKILKTGTPIDDIYVYGVQLEEGSYATSYIPTHGASATRTYDNPNELTHGITMGTSCSIFLEATNFKVTETGGDQTSFLKLRAATSPTEDDRFLFLGSDNTASTFTLKAQNKESGTSTTKTLNKTLLTMGSPFKALARYDGTSFDFFVNGVLEGSETIVADDHFGRVDLKNLTVQAQNGHSISQVILFDSALSNAECIALTTP